MGYNGTRVPDDELNESFEGVNKNEQIIAEMMAGGTLHQAFIISAISEYTKMVVDADMPEPEDGSVPLISPKAWKETAYDIRLRLTQAGYYPQEDK